MNFVDQLMIAQYRAAEEGFHNFEAALNALLVLEKGAEKEKKKRNSMRLDAFATDRDQQQKSRE